MTNAFHFLAVSRGFSSGSVARNPPDNARDTGEAGLIPGLVRSPGGGKEPTPVFLFGACQVAIVVKNPPANAGDLRDTGLIPGLGRSPGGGHGDPL